MSIVCPESMDELPNRVLQGGPESDNEEEEKSPAGDQQLEEKAAGTGIDILCKRTRWNRKEDGEQDSTT
jgi:hypothetical protein